MKTLSLADVAHWSPSGLVEKWDEDQTAWVQKKTGLLAPRAVDFEALKVRPLEVVETKGNLLCNNGIARLEDMAFVAPGSIVAYDNTHARIGVGNGAGTAAATDTDLSAAAGSTNRWFQAVDATFPSRASQTVSWKATFGTADGNFAWNEWGIDGGGASGNTVGTNTATTAALLNHKTSAALGTKASGTTWAFTVTVAIS